MILPLLSNMSDFFLVEEIGTSVLGKPIYKIVLGKGQKRILMWSQMHGNESTTTKAIFDLLNTFKDHDKEESLNDILSRCTIAIIPMLNPDGAEKYTRMNANDIDLNRDAQDLSQPESNVLRREFDDFKPHYCFNLHGQRTIFSAGEAPYSATLSFLAPAQDKDCVVTSNRKVAMDIISRVNTDLQQIIPKQIGIYDDSFNINCVGDLFQSKGVPTILFEAGHFKEDYQREICRALIYYSLLLSLDSVSSNKDLGYNYKSYFQIPKNNKLFRDIIIRNVVVGNEIKDIVIQYREELIEDSVKFIPVIESIETNIQLFGHKEIDAKKHKIESSAELIVGNLIVFVKINGDKFSLFA